MSTPEIKLGYWRERGGGLAIVDERATDDPAFPWWGIDSVGCVSHWRADGSYNPPGLQSKHDLVKYVGPLRRDT